MGHPIIAVTDGNYRNRAELLLKHHHEGMDLDREEALDTLKNLYRVWQRPVNLQTVVEDQPKIYSFDGEKAQEEDAASP